MLLQTLLQYWNVDALLEEVIDSHFLKGGSLVPGLGLDLWRRQGVVFVRCFLVVGGIPSLFLGFDLLSLLDLCEFLALVNGIFEVVLFELLGRFFRSAGHDGVTKVNNR